MAFLKSHRRGDSGCLKGGLFGHVGVFLGVGALLLFSWRGPDPGRGKIFCMSMLRCTAFEIASQDRATAIVNWSKPGTMVICRASPLNASS
jgi:hypothetical protein